MREMDEKKEIPEKTQKFFVGLGYVIWLIALLVLLDERYKKIEFNRYHALHALFYNIVWWATFFVLLFVPLLGWILLPIVFLGGFFLACWFGYRAYNGETFAIPLVTGLVNRYGKRS